MADNKYSNHDIPYFTSVGMFIIDEISFPDFKIDGILGGGGTFAICGSRMVLPSNESNKCSWIVDIGNDCPSEILTELRSWNSGAVFRFDDSRRCTRGWNGYGENDFRSFRYLTPKKRITITDLKDYPWMLHSKSYHFVCSPKRCKELLRELKELNVSKESEVYVDPVVAWEPIPDCCTPEDLQDTYAVLDRVDILTPNAAECANFFGEPEPTDKAGCERIAYKFLEHMKKPNSGIVLRCGSMGSMVLEHENKAVWFPAFHEKTKDATNKVIDPTGCGNTYVGAFTTTFVKHDKDFNVAATYATVASGACIEQHGLPKLTVSDDGQELWNGISFRDRLSEYKNKFNIKNI